MATTIPVQAVLIINGKKVKNTYYQIGREVTKLRNELKKTTVGTKEFQQTAEKLREAEKHFAAVKNEVFSVKKELAETDGRFSGFLNQFGSFGKIATGFFAFRGGLGVIKPVTDELLKISDAITNVEKTSGLATKQVGELWHKFSELDTRTKKLDLMKIAEIGGRLGINKQEDLKGFTEAIDKAYIALGDSFQGGLEEVTTKLGKLKNLFKDTSNMEYPEAINRIGSALNELAAKGTSSEQNISEFATRVGQLPSAFKPAIDKALGLGAAFEESGIDAEIASSGFSNFIMTAAGDIPAFAKQMKMGVKEAENLLNTRPEEFFLKFSESLKGLKASEVKQALKNLKLNTQEVVKAIGAAGQNANRFREMMGLSSEAMVDANSLTDEFNKKNNNSAAIWTKFFKTIKDLITDGIIPEFFDKLTGWLGSVTGLASSAGDGVKIFRTRLIFLVKTLAVATVATLSYRAAKLLSAKATRDEIQQTILKHTVDKISVVLTKAKTAATLLFSAAQKALTGNIKGARMAMMRLNIVTKMNPFGLLLGIITAVVSAMVLFSNSANKANYELKILAETEKEIAKQTAVQINDTKQLLKVARDHTKSITERQKAVDELNRIVPEYNGNLTIESVNTLNATNKLSTYIERLKDAAREKYLKTLVDKKAEEIAKAETSSLEDNIAWYEKLGSFIRSGGDYANYTTYSTQTAKRNKKELIKTLNEELKKTTELYETQKKQHDKNNSNLPKEGTKKDKQSLRKIKKHCKKRKILIKNF